MDRKPVTAKQLIDAAFPKREPLTTAPNGEPYTMPLTGEHIGILGHALRSPNQAYCTDAGDKEMLELVAAGYMSGPMKAGFLAKGMAYFQITRAGRNAVDSLPT